MVSIQLVNGDCLTLLNDVPDQSIDMILCDLPYGSTKCKWDIAIPFDKLWAQYDRVIKENGVVALFATEPFASYLRLSHIQTYKYDWVWDKVKVTGFLNANKQPMRCHELVCIFYSGQCLYNPQKSYGYKRIKSHRGKTLQTEVYGRMNNDNTYESDERYPRSIVVFPSDTYNRSYHPTQKPVALCEYLINTYTNPGEVVLDNCMGSGTTGVACVNTHRNFIGIESDPEYFLTAQQRIAEAQISQCTKK